MALLGDKPVILHTYQNTVATQLFSKVIVVTDSKEIFELIKSVGGDAVMSKGIFESGTDRIAEVALDLDADVILNVQGDSPFMQKDPLQKLLKQFEDPSVQVGSLMRPVTDQVQIGDPNSVKVCVDKNSDSLFFSRSIIPFPRNPVPGFNWYEHIGVYAFRKDSLLKFISLPISPLEDVEKIECLRFLENGIKLRMVFTETKGVEVDTPGDLLRAEEVLKNMI